MAEFKSPLSDPNFLERASAGNVLADALNTPEFVERGVIAARRGNELAAKGTFFDDMQTLNYYEITQKYGREVADNRDKYSTEVYRQGQVRDTPRSFEDKVDDTIVGGISGVAGMVGGLASQVVAEGGSLDANVTSDFGVDWKGMSVDVAEATGDVVEWIDSFQTEGLRERNRLKGIATSLDEDDNLAQMNREIDAGNSEWFSNAVRVGRDVLDAGELWFEDGATATDSIAKALGSVLPSAKMAQGGQALARGIASLATKNKKGLALAGAVGSSIGIGVAEASGTYTDAIGFVMGLSEADMMNAPEYKVLRDGGATHEQAQKVVAQQTGEEAALRQLPTAAALGLLAVRFNTNPFKAFRGKSMMNGLKEVGGQFLEEGLQGGSSELNKNIAIQNQIDETFSLSQGIGGATAEGALAGAGMAGVMGAPRGGRIAAGTAISGALMGGRAVGAGVKAVATPERMGAVGRGAANVSDAAAKLGSKVASVAKPVTAPIAKGAAVVGGAAKKHVGKPVMERVAAYADRPNKKLQTAVIEAAERATDLDPDNQAIAGVRDVIHALAETPPAKMTDEQVVDATGKIIDLVRNAKDLEPEIRDQVLIMLSNGEFNKVKDRYRAIQSAAAEAAPDLSETQDASTPVTPESIQETLDVAKADPSKVNADHIDNILKHEDTDLSEDQVRVLKALRDIKRTLDGHRDAEVTISEDRKIALEKKPAYNGRKAKEATKREDTSQSVQLTGYKDARGNKLRSLAQYAADFIDAMDQADETIIDTTVEEGTTDATTLGKQLGMLVEHLSNKVNAMNESYDKDGADVYFRSLVGGVRMVAAGTPGGAKAFYKKGAPKSVATARATHNDAIAAAQTYNALVRAFPEKFPGGEVTVPSLIIEETTPTTPAVEAVEGASAPEKKAEATPELSTKEEGATDTAEQAETKKKETPDTTAVDATVSPQAQTGEEAVSAPDPLSDQAEMEAFEAEADRVAAKKAERDAFYQKEADEKAAEEQRKQDESIVHTPPTPQFAETFTSQNNEVGYTDGQSILDLLNEGTNTTEGYLSLATQVMAILVKGVNKRVAKLVPESLGDMTLKAHIMGGKDLTAIRDFKALMLVNPETGEYDPNLVSIAAVAVADWLSSVKASDPHQLDKTLLGLGLTLADITSWEFKQISEGVSVKVASESIAKTIMKMWDVKVNGKSQLVDARGAVEGLVKEMLTVLAKDTDLIKINTTPVKDASGNISRTPTINVSQMKDRQKDIELSGQDSVKKLLTPEDVTMPSIGVKIEEVDKFQTRRKVKLSQHERAVLKNLQDEPHYKATGLYGLINAFGFHGLSKALGEKDSSHLSDRHPLKVSIEGKNLSIQRDWDDAMLVLQELEGDKEDTPVYFRVGISKVGRHQYKGINSQNNKILRHLVNPTQSTLDMTKQEHIDAFWLTVAQAADLGQGFKVNKTAHTKILSNVQEKMNEKYGTAIELAMEYINTGVLDQQKFLQALGTKKSDMAIIDAIFAVADLRVQSKKSNNLTEWKTSLAFELDGVTDGPANMMNNFGQGLLSVDDMLNFQRVGFFPGDMSMTINKFFEQNNKDFYETTSDHAHAVLARSIRDAKPADQAELLAATRWSAIFGDFRIVDGNIEMTRDTAKSPTTKTVYGSGVGGVSAAMAKEMILTFYEKMIEVPEGRDAADFLGYEDLKADFQILFGMPFPENADWSQDYLAPAPLKIKGKRPKLKKGKKKEPMAVFEDIIEKGIGSMVTQAAKATMGNKITAVNDLLILMTNIQTEFLQDLYQERLKALGEKRADEGEIGRNKQGGPILQQLSVQDFKDLLEGIKEYSPMYANGMQTLDLGGVSNQPSNMILSTTLDGKLNMKSNMEAPADVGVKVIPYLSIGRGDAMVMNTFYGNADGPTGTQGVYDGVYGPIDKIAENSEKVNAAVMENWDRDVLGDVVADFEHFLSLIGGDAAMLDMVFGAKKEANAKGIGNAEHIEDLLTRLKENHRQNQARKEVFKEIGLSVDHMAGAGVAFTRDGVEVSREEINLLIQAKLDASAPKVVETKVVKETKAKVAEAAKKDKTEIVLPEDGILVTDTVTIIAALKDKSNRLTIRKSVDALMHLLVGNNYKVVIAKDAKQLAAYYAEERGPDAVVQGGIENANGWTDVDGKVMYILTNNHETLVHEMIHLATFDAVQAHYDGTKTNAAVPRLETLMEEFMDMDFSEKNKALRQAANSAKAIMLSFQTSGDSTFNKAAALNEFMAWTLSNAALVKELRETDTFLTRLSRAAMVLIKRILGRVPSDMYHNILFNTVILKGNFEQEAAIEASLEKAPEKQEERKAPAGLDEVLDLEDSVLVLEPSVGDGGNTDGIDKGGDGNGNDGGDGTDGGEIVPYVANHSNFWIDLMRSKLEALKTADGRVEKTAQWRRYQTAAIDAVTKLSFGGFILSEYQQQTFRAIHMVLATEMRLNTQSSTALNQMFEFVMSNMKPEMFGPGAQGQEMYATVMDLLGSTKNDEGVSDAMAVFLALSQTSKAFREALDQLPPPTKDGPEVAGGLNAFLTTLTGMAMNKVLGTVDVSNPDAKAVLDALAANMIREDINKEFTLLRALMGSMNMADKFVSGGMSALAERAAAANREMKKTDRAKLTKLIMSTVTMAASFLSVPRSKAAAQGFKDGSIIHMGVVLDHAVFLREFMTEVVGMDRDNAEVMLQLDRTNYGVSAIRQDFREHLPVIFQDAFDVHPDETQWKAFHTVLAGGDFANLFDVNNPDRAFDLLRDKNTLSAKTRQWEKKINNRFDPKVAATILEKAKQLAGSMMGKGAGHQLWNNAHAINVLSGKYDEAMTQVIDNLVSFYALEIADQAQKDLIMEAYKTDPAAIQNLVTYMQALNKEEDLKDISPAAKMQGRKGWVPNHNAKNAQVTIEADSNGDRLIKMGWVRVGDALADKAFSTVKRGYYTTTVKQGTAYAQGVMQSVQPTYRGVNAVTGHSVAPNMGGLITDPKSLEMVTKQMNKGNIPFDKEALIPVYGDGDQFITAYERVINPDIMAKHARPKANLALMLGSWAGRQVEEKMAAQYNYELIVELKRIYDDRQANEDELYVDISDPDLKDQVFKESWRVISPETKRMIESVFGEGEGFYVQKSMMNLALGYPEPTIVDIWTGKTRMPKDVQKIAQAAAKRLMGEKAVTILSRGEEGVQGTISAAKDVIVVRSLIVPYMNTQANVFQLMTRGVPLKVMHRGYTDKMVEIEQFNANVKRLMVIKTKIAMAGNDANAVRILEQQKQVIQDENARMSIAPLILAGQYKNISEGITDMDVDLMSGRMAEWVENQVNKLPAGVQTVAKQGLLSKDTKVYKMANKAVQYGDFLAKSIYYDFLMSEKGLTHEEALKKISEEYINFSILPGRTRTMLESLGGTWFLSFKIRAIKVALNVIRENPARALITAGTVGEYGSAVNDNAATVIWQDRFGYSIGWEMLLASPELNPYAQIWGWADPLG